MKSVIDCDVLILAGGLGTRLKSVVSDVPKPLAPVAGRPFLQHVLDRLAGQGARRIILSVGHMADKIVDFFGSDYAGMSIVYAHESEPLGTGGAMAYAVGLCESADLLVLNGDTFLGLDYGAFVFDAREKQARLSIVVRAVNDVSRYGSCKVSDGFLSSFSEKGASGPGFINGGVYYMSSDLFASIDPGAKKFSFESDYVALKLAQLQPAAYVADGYFIDIGVPEDYARAQSDFAHGSAG